MLRSLAPEQRDPEALDLLHQFLFVLEDVLFVLLAY